MEDLNNVRPLDDDASRREQPPEGMPSSGIAEECPAALCGKDVLMGNEVIPSFTLERQGVLAWRLIARQIIPLPIGDAFTFFRDPRNLNSIIPDWLEFTMACPQGELNIYEGAEIDYTIHWFGLRFRCISRIEEYHPPERFTGVQLTGPYRTWRHLHTFTPVPEGTLLVEEVTYRLPVRALFLEWLVNRHLEKIFACRAAGIAAWATKEEKTRRVSVAA